MSKTDLEKLAKILERADIPFEIYDKDKDNQVLAIDEDYMGGTELDFSFDSRGDLNDIHFDED